MSNSKECPYCAEKIKYKALKCKHCGEFLPESDPYREEEKVKLEEERKERQGLEDLEYKRQHRNNIIDHVKSSKNKKYQKYKGCIKAKISFKKFAAEELIDVIEDEFCLEFANPLNKYCRDINLITEESIFYNYLANLFFDETGRIKKLESKKGYLIIDYDNLYKDMKEVKFFHNDGRYIDSIERKSKYYFNWDNKDIQKIVEKSSYVLIYPEYPTYPVVKNDEKYMNGRPLYYDYKDIGDNSILLMDGYPEGYKYTKFNNSYSYEGQIESIEESDDSEWGRGGTLLFQYNTDNYLSQIGNEKRIYDSGDLIDIIIEGNGGIRNIFLDYDFDNRLTSGYMEYYKKGIIMKKLVSSASFKIKYF